MDPFSSLLANPRITCRRSGVPRSDGECVVYWMQRAQRALDNPALEVAVNAANILRKPCVVFFAPVPFYPRANLRHYAFLIQGIPAIARRLEARGIGFVVRPYPDHHLLRFCAEVKPAVVVSDENPMREPAHWRQAVAQQLKIPFWTVDSDVIVPSRLLVKEHYAARTIRPLIQRLLPAFLEPVGNIRAKVPWKLSRNPAPIFPDSNFTNGWPLDRSVSPVRGFVGGTDEAVKRLKTFVRRNLSAYARDRNHPELSGTSRLSPYLHFGHIGPHTVALAVEKADAPRVAKSAFLEQLIVRRELAVNFVYFNPNYDNFGSAPAWAEKTLADHARDRRKTYSRKQLENAATHDPLWNAAQKQMVVTGWMHNYMRMYWAKKILEWNKSPVEAFSTAVYLNDKYELDGRDPNGYAGIAWAIAGKHDRPWFRRPVFGNVRSMSFTSTSKKFDSRRYIREMESL